MMKMEFFFLLSLVTQTVSQDIRSIYLSKLPDTKYQCNTSACSLSTIILSSNVRNCQIACLNNEQCLTVTFNRNNRNCEMFVDIPSQYGSVSAQIGTITMIVVDGRKLSTSTTTTTATTTTTSQTTSSTSSTTTTASLNPCAPNGLRWNTTGITILDSTYVTNVSNLNFDQNGTLYIADQVTSHVVWKLTKNATVPTVVAGILGNPGPNSNQLNYPQDAHIDSDGNLYVSESNNYRIQKYVNGSTNGITIAGITGSYGPGLNLLLNPRHFKFDPTYSYLYIADKGNHRVLSYLTNSTSGKNGTIVAGDGTAGNTTSTLTYPWGIDYVPSLSSDLFITNSGGHSVIRWTPGASSGVFIAGTPGVSGSDSLSLNSPYGIKVDNYLNFYVADSDNNRIQMFCANNQTGITIAGTGVAGNSATQLSRPWGLAFDTQMNLYVADYNNKRVQKFMKL